MKNSFKSFLYSVGLLAFFLFPMATQAHYCINGANGVSCPSSPTNYLMMPNTGNCVLETTVNGWDATCAAGSSHKVVSCAVGNPPPCVCETGYTDCSGTCVLNTTPDSNIPTCASQGKSFSVCGTCGACLPGYAAIGPNCVRKVEVVRTATDTYRALDNVTLEDFIVAIGGGLTCANNQTPVWDTDAAGTPPSPHWKCGVASQWHDNSNGIDYTVAGKNVGIGNATPNRKLEVDVDRSTASATKMTEFSLNERLFLDAQGDPASSGVGKVRLTNNVYIDGSDAWVFKDPAKNASIISLNDDGKVKISGSIAPNNTGFRTLATFDAVNNVVGIGTTAPGVTLDVYGTSRVYSNVDDLMFLLTNIGTNGRNYAMISTGGTSSLGAGKFVVYDGTSSAARLTIDSLGNVGIGSTGSAYKLDVNGTGNFSGDITTSTNIKATGTIDSTGCFGPVFQGESGNSSGGKPGTGGYFQANAMCSSYGAGAHVCTTAEALNSINCNAISGKGASDTHLLWVSNGAPSLPTPTNDCYGWTQNDSASKKGIQWLFDHTTGGGFYAQPCNTPVYFACCK